MHYQQPNPSDSPPSAPAENLAPSEQTPPLPGAEQHEQDDGIQPRIWVASLADFNHGTVHGVWLRAAQKEADLQAAIATMLAASPLAAETGQPVEDWAVRGTYDFGSCNLIGLRDLELISRMAHGIVEHGLAFAAWAGLIEHPERLDEFNDAYQGHYDSLHAYVEQLVNDLGYDELIKRVVPPRIRPYVKIDIAATANDMVEGGDLAVVAAPDGGVWIFNA